MTRPSPITEERIRERAYRLWIEEGQPQGKDAEHWQKARELLALEADLEEGGPVEKAVILENQGVQEVPKKRPTTSKHRPKIVHKRPM